MIIRSISLKGVSGAATPASFSVEPGESRHALDPALAAAVPAVIMTLLYPDEVSTTDIARISGPEPSSAWRAEFEVGRTIFRVSRSFSNDSITLEVQEGSSWRVDARGATGVRRALAQLTKLPAPTVMETLNFWINVNDAPGKAATAGAGGGSAGASGMILGTEDYFGNFADEPAPEAAPMDEEERRLRSDTYRQTRTVEFVEQQTAHADERLENIIGRLGALVDETGEMARLTRELSRLPQVRELTAEEREVFDDPDIQLGDLERRISALDIELEVEGRKRTRVATTLSGNHSFVFGIVGTVLLTAVSIFGGPEARRWALLNVISMGVTLAGFLQWLANKDSVGTVGRKRQLLERRREGLVARRAEMEGLVARLRAELPVGTLAELERVHARRTEIEQKLVEVRKSHEAAYETPEYAKMLAKKERAETKLQALRLARSRLGDVDLNSYELGNTLEAAGIDPNVVLWRPEPPTIEIRRRVKRLGQVASKYRLISEDGLNPKTVASWMRIAHRIVGEDLPPMNLSPEHQMVLEDGSDALAVMSHDVATAVVEAFRMSLHLTLVKAKAPGVYAFCIDVHPERMGDETVRRRFDRMYKGLGERLQVLVLTSNR